MFGLHKQFIKNVIGFNHDTEVMCRISDNKCHINRQFENIYESEV